MQTIVSPSAVEFLDFFETDKSYCIVQEYCEGGDLDRLDINYLYFKAFLVKIKNLHFIRQSFWQQASYMA
jgi:serine/threonine protein kinase